MNFPYLRNFLFGLNLLSLFLFLGCHGVSSSWDQSGDRYSTDGADSRTGNDGVPYDGMVREAYLSVRETQCPDGQAKRDILTRNPGDSGITYIPACAPSKQTTVTHMDFSTNGDYAGMPGDTTNYFVHEKVFNPKEIRYRSWCHDKDNRADFVFFISKDGKTQATIIAVTGLLAPLASTFPVEEFITIGSEGEFFRISYRSTTPNRFILHQILGVDQNPDKEELYSYWAISERWGSSGNAKCRAGELPILPSRPAFRFDFTR